MLIRSKIQNYFEYYFIILIEKKKIMNLKKKKEKREKAIYERLQVKKDMIFELLRKIFIESILI